MIGIYIIAMAIKTGLKKLKMRHDVVGCEISSLTTSTPNLKCDAIEDSGDLSPAGTAVAPSYCGDAWRSNHSTATSLLQSIDLENSTVGSISLVGTVLIISLLCMAA